VQLLTKTSQLAIYDNFLEKEDYEQVWQFVQSDTYSYPFMAGGWIKVWRLGDLQPLGGTNSYFSKAPFNNPLDLLIDPIRKVLEENSELTKGYQDVSMRSYLYSRGTKLSWHNDTGNYKGAFTYYVHPEWASTWGGELMIAQIPPQDKVWPTGSPHLDHRWEDYYISAYGIGQFIRPRSNRMVLLTSGVYHAINRIDEDAGDHVRCSIQGFLLDQVYDGK